MEWEQWATRLVAVAARGGMGGIDPDDYRDYYEDGHTPEDAWAEDCSHAD